MQDDQFIIPIQRISLTGRRRYNYLDIYLHTFFQNTYYPDYGSDNYQLIQIYIDTISQELKCIGIGKGASYLSEYTAAYVQNMDLVTTAGVTGRKVKVALVDDQESYVIQLLDHQRLYFIERWIIDSNQKWTELLNYDLSAELIKKEKREIGNTIIKKYLDRNLKKHIHLFLSELGVEKEMLSKTKVETFQKITVEIDYLKKYKKLAVTAYFTCNWLLPDDIGLGSGVNVGRGRIRSM